MRKTVIIGCIAGLATCLPFARFGRPISGVVVEAQTGRPLQNATVIAVWNGRVGWIHGMKTCYHVETATSDADGRFSMRTWFSGFSFPVGERSIVIRAVMPGYYLPAAEPQRDDIVYVSKFSGSAQSYFDELQFVYELGDCRNADLNGELGELYSIVAKDAAPKAETEEQMRRVQFLVESAATALAKFSARKK